MAIPLNLRARSCCQKIQQFFGLSIFALAIFGLSFTPLACGQQPAIDSVDEGKVNSSATVKEDDGYQKIFNGKDFEGWAGDVDGFAIQDGILRNKPQSGGTIFTQKEWSDFSVRFEFRLPAGGNNGLAIRYPGDGDTAYVGMCELQILDNTAEKFKNLDPRQKHGSVYGVVAAKTGHLLPVGQWNAQEVTVVGTKIKVELNGAVIVDTDVAGVSQTGRRVSG